jgi:hypothetical protein
MAELLENKELETKETDKVLYDDIINVNDYQLRFRKYVYNEGHFYVGSMMRDYRHGTGILLYQNKDIYDGSWYIYWNVDKR